MQLRSIIINNFKGIKDVTVDFKAGFNILIGDNGVGKTSILEAISVGLGGFLAGISEIDTKHIVSDEIRMESKLSGDGSYNIKLVIGANEWRKFLGRKIRKFLNTKQ